VHGVFLSCCGDSESSPRLQFRRARGRDSAQVVTPFVQVGTSCDSTVSRGIDYTFTWSKRAEYLVFCALARSTRAGVLWIAFPADPSRDLTPESLRGSRCFATLPSVLPAAHLHGHREGSTDLSQLNERDRSRSGQFHLPDKEFRYLRLSVSCMSPCRTDYIIFRRESLRRSLACSL
jgi:hypothetical protein